MEKMIATGTTDDFTTCDCCGRADLKVTVRMVIVDEDGNQHGEAAYYGSDCASRASGRPLGEIRTEAREGDRAAAAAAAAAKAAASAARFAAAEAVWTAKYGTADRYEIERLTGLSPFAVWNESVAALDA